MAYDRQLRREIVAMARSGRSAAALAKDVKPSAGTIRRWIKQADLDEATPSGEATTTEVRQLRRDVKRLRLERDILRRAISWFRGGKELDPRDGFAFMNAHRNILPVRAMCRSLGSSPSGYHAWVKRPPSLRARRDAVLRGKVYASWRDSRRTYGRRRIHADLKAQGERVSRKRIARLMHEMGIKASGHRRKKTAPMRRKAASAQATPDLVNRHFRASNRNDLWVADISQVPTQAGWLYVAVVLDVWSRMVVGWAVESHSRAELVEQALDMAVRRRSPTNVVHHSDRGTQYSSHAFRARCRDAHIRRSMGATGEPYDNALCESFFATLKREALGHRRFTSLAHARAAVINFLEGFYNSTRRHSALGYDSPETYEQRSS